MKLLDELKRQLNAYRPLNPHMLKNLQEKLIIEWTYHSNAIEGNTLTMSETKVVLEHGITIAKKPIKDHLEAIGHKEAILFLFNVVRHQETMSERLIKELHNIILRKVDPDIAGRYRNCQVSIAGSSHEPPSYLHLATEMGQLIDWYQEVGPSLHPVERAAILHAEFVRIHPFQDGNGRTARLLLNLELMRSEYVPIIIKTADRLEYYDALDKYGTSQDASLFVQMVEELETASLQYYLRFVQ
jgi:Fic family protein